MSRRLSADVMASGTLNVHQESKRHLQSAFGFHPTCERRRVAAERFHFLPFLLDFRVDLGGVIVVVGEGGMDLRRTKRLVLTAHVLDRPTMRELVHHDLCDPNARQSLEARGLPSGLLNVRVARRGGHERIDRQEERIRRLQQAEGASTRQGKSTTLQRDVQGVGPGHDSAKTEDVGPQTRFEPRTLSDMDSNVEPPRQAVEFATGATIADSPVSTITQTGESASRITSPLTTSSILRLRSPTLPQGANPDPGSHFRPLRGATVFFEANWSAPHFLLHVI